MNRRWIHAIFCPLIAFLVTVPVMAPFAAESPAPMPFDPPIAAASEEGLQAIGAFSAPEGFDIELVAAEPLLANPVAFYIDFDGNIYVAETFRHFHGVGDMRNYREWLVDDLASRTVEDRLVAMKKNLDDFPAWSEAHDRIRKLWDSDGDGVADRATVYADGFKDTLAGIGAGVLVDRGSVYYTCIPELWRMRDEDGDGIADQRSILSSGYGVHINFLGHDLHGLRKGPDGRLYFSIGDRGVSIRRPDGSRLEEPDTGAVFRCNMDGTDLEIVHRGLRNPQELAFDNYGNLFTGDNNSDAGDQARWVWIVEGGDSGWRIGYQWVTKPNTRGPWNAEKMWEPRYETQPAHIVPPLLNIGAGPSGLTFYPGTGMSEVYNDTFFLCDFRGDAGRSLIHSFKMTPKGASFEVVNRQDFGQHMLATDVEFGMKPGIYFSDWVQGWDKPMKGRIYRMHETAQDDNDAHSDAVHLLQEGMVERTPDALVALLGHADQRVRFEAQYALADLGGDARAPLSDAAQHGATIFARLHGIWGLWQLLLQGDIDATPLLPFLSDSDEEVRLQAARVLGDGPASQVLVPLRNTLVDSSIRVQFHGASSLGKLEGGDEETTAALIELLRRNDNQDAYVRHAAVFGLCAQATEGQLASLALDPSPAVRLGGLLALRRLNSGETARFLRDADPFIVLEATRAIHDTPIMSAYPALAALATSPSAPATEETYTWRRILNARFRMGGLTDASALLQAATVGAIPESARIEALDNLARWMAPPALDPVTGAWDPMNPEREDITDVVAAALPTLLNAPSDALVLAVGGLCEAYHLDGALPALVALAANVNSDAKDRVRAMETVARVNREALRPILAQTLGDASEEVRAASLTQITTLDPAVASAAIVERLKSGGTREKQAAVTAISGLKPDDGEELLVDLLRQLHAGDLDPVIQLEVLQVAKVSPSKRVAEALKKCREASSDDPLSPQFPALFGGDSAAGRTVFFEKAETQCLRCHTLNGEGGSQVGPELTGIGSRVERRHILEAIVTPNAAIAEGFENVSVTMTDGRFITGRLLGETETELVLEVQQEEDPFGDEEIPHSEVDTVAEDAAHGEELLPAQNLIKMNLDKKLITERKRALSSMPDGLATFLSLNELRNLVEFLSSQK